MKVVSAAWWSWIRGPRSPPAHSIDSYARFSSLPLRISRPFGPRYSSGWANSSKQGRPTGWNRRRIMFASGSAVTGATVLAFTDDIKASYETVERTGRVAVGLAVCINE